MAADPASTAVAAEPRSGIELFRIAGIRIRLDYSWFLIFLLLLWSLSAGYFPAVHPGEGVAFYWLAGLAAVLLFFASILLHELAHSLVAMWYGIEIPSITLFLFGGVSAFRHEPKRPLDEAAIAIAGPLTSFALAGCFWGILALLSDDTAPLLQTALGYLAWVNVALGVFNLLPGYPLDGGRVLRALVWWRTGSLARATRFASGAGRWLAFAIMLLGGVQIFLGSLLGGLWLVLIGMFLRSMAEAGYQNLVVRRVLEGATVDQVMRRNPVTVAPDLTLQRLADDYVLARGYRGFPVVQDGRVLGLITMAELQQVPRAEWERRTVGELMRPAAEPNVVAPDAPLADALARMSASGSGRLLVLERDRLAGILTKEGLLQLVETRRLLEPA